MAYGWISYSIVFSFFHNKIFPQFSVLILMSIFFYFPINCLLRAFLCLSSPSMNCSSKSLDQNLFCQEEPDCAPSFCDIVSCLSLFMSTLVEFQRSSELDFFGHKLDGISFKSTDSPRENVNMQQRFRLC